MSGDWNWDVVDFKETEKIVTKFEDAINKIRDETAEYILKSIKKEVEPQWFEIDKGKIHLVITPLEMCEEYDFKVCIDDVVNSTIKYFHGDVDDLTKDSIQDIELIKEREDHADWILREAECLKKLAKKMEDAVKGYIPKILNKINDLNE